MKITLPANTARAVAGLMVDAQSWVDIIVDDESAGGDSVVAIVTVYHPSDDPLFDYDTVTYHVDGNGLIVLQEMEN